MIHLSDVIDNDPDDTHHIVKSVDTFAAATVFCPWVSSGELSGFLRQKLQQWSEYMDTKWIEMLKLLTRGVGRAILQKMPKPKNGISCVQNDEEMEKFGKPQLNLPEAMPMMCTMAPKTFLDTIKHYPCLCLPHWFINCSKEPLYVLSVDVDIIEHLELSAVWDSIKAQRFSRWCKDGKVQWSIVPSNDCLWVPPAHAICIINNADAAANIACIPHCSRKMGLDHDGKPNTTWIEMLKEYAESGSSASKVGPMFRKWCEELAALEA